MQSLWISGKVATLPTPLQCRHQLHLPLLASHSSMACSARVTPTASLVQADVIVPTVAPPNSRDRDRWALRKAPSNLRQFDGRARPHLVLPRRALAWPGCIRARRTLRCRHWAFLHRLTRLHPELGGTACGARDTPIALSARQDTVLLGIVGPALSSLARGFSRPGSSRQADPGTCP